MSEITTITLSLPYRLGAVNCYLIETVTGFTLIDTGSSNGRARLQQELASAGCRPGKLGLIVLTHGDFDHTGNAAYLRKEFDARIAMHRDDSGMAERGDMFYNRSKGGVLLRTMAPLLFGFGRSKRFKPDRYIDEGLDLSEYGLDAKVRHLPGHSKGSIVVVTAAGDLFCGDLLVNNGRPALNRLIDDRAQAEASLERLADLGIKTVYPGHGRPFPMALIK